MNELKIEGLTKLRVPFKKKSTIKNGRMFRNIVVVGLIAYYLIFLIIPIGIAFVGSFYEWNPLKGIFNFRGFENYSSIFRNELFWRSIWNTLLFSAVVIFFRVILGLGLSTAIYSKLIKRKNLYRAVYYMPVVTPLVAVAFVWTWMYEPQIGFINQILGTKTNWLYNANTALGAVMLMTIWKDFGYAVVLFLAGLYSLPKDCYEAAAIDGATGWKTFLYITLPLLKPTTLFVVVTSLISYLQTYVQIMVMTEGGPGTATYLSSYMIFKEAFENYNFGSASAMSFILFIIISILSYLSFKVSSSEKGGKLT